MSNWRGKSLWSVSSRAISAGLVFLLNIILARSMSQNEVGRYFLGMSIAWGGGLVSQWGASILAVKWIADARARQDSSGIRRAVWSLVAFALLQGIAVSAVLLSWHFIRPLPWATVMVWALWSFAIAAQTLTTELIRGFDDLKWASLFGGPIPQFCNIVLIGGAHLIWKNLGFTVAAGLTVAGNLACALLGLMMIHERAPLLKEKLISYRDFLNEATPIGLSLAAVYVLSQADLWVCGAILSREDVAVYGIAQRFNQIIGMPMLIFSSVAIPTLAELMAKKDWENLRQVLAKGTLIVSLLAVVAFAAAGVFGWPLLRYLIGPEYTAAYPLVLILGLGQVAHAVVGPNGYLLLLSGEQRAAMLSTCAATAILFALAWPAGLHWGVKGVAWSSAAAVVFQSALMWFLVRKRLRLHAHVSVEAARRRAS